MSAAARSLRTRVPPWVAVFGLLLACAWCGNQFTPLLLLYKDREHDSALTVNLFLAVYVLGLAPSLLFAGGLSDRLGRRPLMLGAALAGIAASTSLAFGALGGAPIYLGRFLAGLTVGTAMAVGTSWLRELSQTPHDPRADRAAGARRTSLAFTLGSAGGALVAGVLAQWTRWGEELPFLVHIAITLPLLFLGASAPETVRPTRAPTLEVVRELRLPSLGHKRFTRVVLVMAPWLFASAALGYGLLPELLTGATGHLDLAYATLLSVTTLGLAALVQPLARRLDSAASGRALVIALATIAAGIAAMALSDHAQSVWLGVLAAAILGAGLGIGLPLAAPAAPAPETT